MPQSLHHNNLVPSNIKSLYIVIFSFYKGSLYIVIEHVNFIFLIFTTSLIWFGSQFWYHVVSAPSDRSCEGSDCGPPYQVQRQSPLNQLTIISLTSFYYNLIITLIFSSPPILQHNQKKNEFWITLICFVIK
jgi:hypothetical protein